MNILVTGASGQLGQCLRDVLAAEHYNLVVVDRATLDLSEPASIVPFLQGLKPAAVINAAAYTAVDKAETESELAYKINAQAPAQLAGWCAASKVPFIHLSTDYVFNGEHSQPYRETDVPQPQGVYGASKLAGEQAVVACNPDAVIVRTSWVFSEYGTNFVKTMLRLASERDSLAVVADQIGCPTYAGDLAVALRSVLAELLTGAKAGGLYHYSGKEQVSWYEFAQAIFSVAQSTIPNFKTPVVRAITTADYPTPARRPAWSVLDCSKIVGRFAVTQSDWRAALVKVNG